MGAIHHDVGGHTGFLQRAFRQGHGHRIVVGLAAAATQHHVGIGVALGGGERHPAVRVDAQETVRMLDAEHGVDRHIQAAVGAVLEAHRAGQAGGHFPVGLGFGGTRADRRPGDQILYVLRGGRVERLGGRRQAQLGHVEQQLAGNVQAVLHFEGVVHVGVVDQTLPAHRGTRLFEIHAQHQKQGVVHLGGQLLEPLGVFHGRFRVMDGAGADHHEQARILAVEDVADLLATLEYGFRRRFAERQLFLQGPGGDQHLLGFDVEIV